MNWTSSSSNERPDRIWSERPGGRALFAYRRMRYRRSRALDGLGTITHSKMSNLSIWQKLRKTQSRNQRQLPDSTSFRRTDNANVPPSRSLIVAQSIQDEDDLEETLLTALLDGRNWSPEQHVIQRLHGLCGFNGDRRSLDDSQSVVLQRF